MEIHLITLLLTLSFPLARGSATDVRDAAVLQSLKNTWQNLPRGWVNSTDPCGDKWEGVTCSNGRVTSLQLSSMGLKGTLPADIGGLSELLTLDLSFNEGLTGSLPPTIGYLTKLRILIADSCSFSGNIPEEIGYISGLAILALNSNSFTGEIPSSLGKLSELFWLDLSDNQLTGFIPVSPGLDQLLHAKHFLLDKNMLTGSIPPELFSSEMVLGHLLLNNNQLTGPIPSTLGLVRTLQTLRLDKNFFSGPIPSNFGNLSSIKELNLANNHFTGPVPDLSAMQYLNYVDLSNNSFDPAEAPAWFSTLWSLNALRMEGGSLTGPVPEALFRLPQLKQVKMGNNSFNGTLSMGSNRSELLDLVDLQFNNITAVILDSEYPKILKLYGNPVCTQYPNMSFCQEQQQEKPYSTSLANCGNETCPSDQKLSPLDCDCAYPYQGNMSFRAPTFRDLSNSTVFHSLEMSLWAQLNLTAGSVYLQNPFFTRDDYLQVEVGLFPSNAKKFNVSEVLRIESPLLNQTFKPPPAFGPYYFIPAPYPF